MTLDEMIADAQAKYHRCVTGRLAVKVVVDGQETTFNPANAHELLAYISRLIAMKAGRPTAGAIGVVF